MPPRLVAAPRGMPHEILIVRDSAYSVTGQNAGQRANLRLPWHYPVRAVCSVCSKPVRRGNMAVSEMDWLHAEPDPGDNL